jgi:hypothetical protein
MNHIRLDPSFWIIIINIILLVILLYNLYSKSSDSFINYPQQVNPMAKPMNNSDVEQANNNYSALLMFIQNNPSKSLNFIQDIRQKFFDDSCKVKSNIDFRSIAQFPLGVPFS